MIRAALLFCASSACAQGEIPLDGFALDKLTLGRAYTIYRDGTAPYGITTFHPNRQVTWIRFGEECTSGTWSEPEPGLICFDYPHRETPACWTYFNDGDRVRLHWQDSPTDVYFYEDAAGHQTSCDAPDLS